LIACIELHTFSSLNANFLKEYEGSMLEADEALVYFNPHTIEHKKLEPIHPHMVLDAFGGNNVQVFTDSSQLRDYLLSKKWSNSNLLMMSSGTFDGIDFHQLASELKML
jgi:UDP-N-acetylmuramate: L-alanyl-gamma-D-glutamyl-meso-diaminopimelate ligase